MEFRLVTEGAVVVVGALVGAVVGALVGAVVVAAVVVAVVDELVGSIKGGCFVHSLPMFAGCEWSQS